MTLWQSQSFSLELKFQGIQEWPLRKWDKLLKSINVYKRLLFIASFFMYSFWLKVSSTLRINLSFRLFHIFKFLIFQPDVNYKKHYHNNTFLHHYSFCNGSDSTSCNILIQHGYSAECWDTCMGIGRTNSGNPHSIELGYNNSSN